MYYDFLQKNKRIISIVAICFFGLLIAWSVVTLIGRIGKLPLQISVVPSDASITINGGSYHNGTVWIKAGTYTMTVEKSGFTTQKKSVAVTDQKDKNVVAVSLVAESDDAKKWADQHKDEYSKNEQYGAIEADQAGKYFSAKNPITDKLPFKDPYFTISYQARDDLSIKLLVDTPSPRYRFYAIEKIRELGYDPTDFEIEFSDFHNPLGTK